MQDVRDNLRAEGRPHYALFSGAPNGMRPKSDNADTPITRSATLKVSYLAHLRMCHTFDAEKNSGH